MTNTKLIVTVAMVAVMLAAVAGSAAFAQQPPGQQQPGGQQPSSPGPGIVGGTTVTSNKYPFMAALLDTRRSGNEVSQQFCGGTLIDSDSVLTAAHCVDVHGTGSTWNLPPTSNDVANLRVVVGRTQLTSTQGQVRGVSEIDIPGHWYDSIATSTNKWDVAVLRLSNPVTSITPIRIPAPTDNWYEQPGKGMTVAGWGSITAAGSYPDQMQEAKVPVVSDAEAVKIFGSEFDPKLMIAAGDASKSHCMGDSGGPLFASGPKPIGKRPPGAPAGPTPPYQYGITSFAKLNGGEVQCEVDPAGYTEVNYPTIRSWILGYAGK